MTDLPSGTLTFLLTDIEGSSRLWEADPRAMRQALDRHNDLLRDGIERHGGTGRGDGGEGDSFFAIFPRAREAVAAACAIQQALQQEPWPGGIALFVRMALHTGESEAAYWHPQINRCARLRALAHGGQVLISGGTQVLVRDALPDGVGLLDLGEHRLRDLTRPERIYQLLHRDLLATFAPLASLGTYQHNLPVQLSSFIGRGHEVAELKQRLHETRLITLTGAAGCGKTRLALHVAAEMLDRYADGVWLVELAALAEPGLVAQEIASSLALREQPGRPLHTTVIEHVRTKQLLLVLDNCEHLLEACARLAAEMLGSCPNVSVLATSREALNVAGETSWRVPSLSVPDASLKLPLESLSEYEAVHLFLDRARSSNPSFVPTDQQALVQLCQRLDGIPLAIELAAARLKILPLEEILRRLQDRFRLLTGGSRNALPRQQTLQAAVDWSYKLMTEAEQLVFRRLAVFTGGFTLEAAETVCAGDGVTRDEILPLLSRICDQSMVLVAENQTRYGLLETLRQYGTDRLLEKDEVNAIRASHARYYEQLAVAAESRLRGPEQALLLEQLEADHDNLRAAIESALSTDPGESLRLVAALAPFWEIRGYLSEGREWCRRALNQGAGADADRARALHAGGMLALRQADYPCARTSLMEALALGRAIEDQRGMGRELNALAVVAQEQGDLVDARSFLEESVTLHRTLDDQRGMASALNNLGLLAEAQEDLVAAAPYLDESLAIYRALEDRWRIAVVLTNRAILALRVRDPSTAAPLLSEGLTILRDLKDRGWVLALCLDTSASLASVNRQAERALRLAGAASKLRELTGAAGSPEWASIPELSIEPSRRALGQPVAEAAWEAGRAMPLADAIDYALSAGPVRVAH